MPRKPGHRQLAADAAVAPDATKARRVVLGNSEAEGCLRKTGRYMVHLYGIYIYMVWYVCYVWYRWCMVYTVYGISIWYTYMYTVGILVPKRWFFLGVLVSKVPRKKEKNEEKEQIISWETAHDRLSSAPGRWNKLFGSSWESVSLKPWHGSCQDIQYDVNIFNLSSCLTNILWILVLILSIRQII